LETEITNLREVSSVNFIDRIKIQPTMFHQLHSETQVKHLDGFLELISTLITFLIMSELKKAYIEI